MKSSYIAIGYRCNHHCLTCPLSGERYPDTKIEDIMKMIESLSPGDHITFSGGEPTLYSNLLTAVEFALKKRIRMSLLTNISSFANVEYAKKFKSIDKNNQVNIITAIYHLDSSIHDHLTGC